MCQHTRDEAREVTRGGRTHSTPPWSRHGQAYRVAGCKPPPPGTGGEHFPIAYADQPRTREIGVRLALGAGSGNVLGMVEREGLGMSAVGVALGLVGAAALTRVLRSLLFGVTTTDPLTFASVAVVLSLVAIAASLIPARRAASIDPQRALRTD